MVWYYDTTLRFNRTEKPKNENKSFKIGALSEPKNRKKNQKKEPKIQKDGFQHKKSKKKKKSTCKRGKKEYNKIKTVIQTAKKE